MKILHLITRGNGGGTEVSLTSNISYELTLGHEVLLVSSSDAIANEIFKKKNEKFTFIKLEELSKNSGLRQRIKAYFLINSILQSFSPDLLHTHETLAGIFGRLAKRNSHQISVHSVHMSLFCFQISFLHYWLYWPVEKILSKYTDFYIFVGNEIMKQYRSLNLNARVGSFLVPSNINLDKFVIEAQRKEENRTWILDQSNLVVKNDTAILVTVGMLEKRKRQKLIISKLAPLLKSNCVLMIVGEGESRIELESFCMEIGVSDRVQFVGYSNKVERYIAGADVLVHASTLEGVPQVLLQSVACRTPAVCTRVMGSSELEDIYAIPRSGRKLRRKVEQILQMDSFNFSLDYSKWSSENVEEVYSDTLRRIEHISSSKSKDRRN